MVALLLITTCHGQFWRAEDGRVPVALASAECGTGGDGDLSPAPAADVTADTYLTLGQASVVLPKLGHRRDLGR
jgi:hypothetical protein